MRISDWSSDVCSSDLWSEFSPWLSKNPPAITIDLPVVLIALRLHAIGYPLIDGRKTIAYLHFLQRIEVDHHDTARARGEVRSEEHTSELQSLMRISYAVFCFKITTQHKTTKSSP